MVRYKCFFCEKEIKPEYMRKKVRCPYCGNKIAYKVRTVETTVKAH